MPSGTYCPAERVFRPRSQVGQPARRRSEHGPTGGAGSFAAVRAARRAGRRDLPASRGRRATRALGAADDQSDGLVRWPRVHAGRDARRGRDPRAPRWARDAHRRKHPIAVTRGRVRDRTREPHGRARELPLRVQHLPDRSAARFRGPPACPVRRVRRFRIGRQLHAHTDRPLRRRRHDHHDGAGHDDDHHHDNHHTTTTTTTTTLPPTTTTTTAPTTTTTAPVVSLSLSSTCTPWWHWPEDRAWRIYNPNTVSVDFTLTALYVGTGPDNPIVSSAAPGYTTWYLPASSSSWQIATLSAAGDFTWAFNSNDVC